MDFVQIDLEGLPEEEREYAVSLRINLLSLQMNALEFRQSANLYLFAHARKALFIGQTVGPPDMQRMDDVHEMVGLIKIAGRNGAVVAASFFELTQAINGTRQKAPTIWSNADVAERDKGSKLFAKEFPQISQIRQSAAHPGELSKNPKESAAHRLKKPLQISSIQANGPIFVEAMMEGSDGGLKFGATFKGDYVEYELSMQKADALDAVANHYCRTFYPLEHPSAAQQREWLKESDRLRQQDQSARPPWWHNLIRL